MTKHISIIHRIIDFITAPIRNYRRKKQFTTQEARNKEAMEFNHQYLTPILKNFPERHVLLVKLNCGIWCNDFYDIIPSLVHKVVQLKHSSYYLHGTGLIALDPDHYQRDPAKIAEEIFSIHDQLDGAKIIWWKSAEKVS